MCKILVILFLKRQNTYKRTRGILERNILAIQGKGHIAFYYLRDMRDEMSYLDQHLCEAHS